jgi:hypothetical protein
MTDIVTKLRGFCHTLRHDGIDYGDYIEQLTYLLFLKMIEEKGLEVPFKTGGFLVCAYEWLMEQNGGSLERSEAKRILTDTYLFLNRTCTTAQKTGPHEPLSARHPGQYPPRGCHL